jgi:hypothetical protein
MDVVCNVDCPNIGFTIGTDPDYGQVKAVCQSGAVFIINIDNGLAPGTVPK